MSLEADKEKLNSAATESSEVDAGLNISTFIAAKSLGTKMDNQLLAEGKWLKGC